MAGSIDVSQTTAPPGGVLPTDTVLIIRNGATMPYEASPVGFPTVTRTAAGLAPASGGASGDAAKFLREDGAWAVPPGGGTGTAVTVDEVTIHKDPDTGVLSMIGKTADQLEDAGALVGTDKLVIRRSGEDWDTTLDTLHATPAGERSASLPAALAATDHGKTVLLTGTSGTLSAGTLPAGFACTVINTASGAATLSGITDPSGATTIAAGESRAIRKGGSAVYALGPFNSGGAATAATAYTLTQGTTSGTTGAAHQISLAPTGGLWKPGTLTLTLSGSAATLGNIAGGTLSGGVVTPAFGSSSITLDLTPTVDGTVNVTPSNTMGLSNPGVLSYAAAGGGGSFPNLTLTSPTFANNGKFGSQTLSGGSGTGAVTVTAACGVGLWFACVGSHYCTFLQVQGMFSAGKAFDSAEVNFDGNGQAVNNGTAPSSASGTAHINEGNWHWLYFARDGLTGTARWFVDGVSQTPNVNLNNQSLNLILNLDPGVEPDGAWFDSIQVWNGTDDSRATPPSGAPSHDANTVALWTFSGNGTGS